MNLWKYSRFGYNVHDYSKYDVYQNVDGSRFQLAVTIGSILMKMMIKGDVIMDDPSDMPEPQQRQQQDTTSSTKDI